MGRPTKLTPEIQQTIVTFMGAGSYVETAAAAAGISKVTLYNWLRRGADDEEPYAEFLNAVEKAAGEADLRDLKTIRQAAQDGVWQAAAWRLERRHPGQWGRRPPEVVVEPSTVVQIIDNISRCDSCSLDTGESDEDDETG